MILVTGATGYTGRFLLPRLAETGQSLCCLVRPTSDREWLDRMGVKVHIGDLEQPGAVRPAFRGVERVLHLAHIRYARAIVECVDSQIEQVVLVSSLRCFSRVPSASVEEVRGGEDCIRLSGMPYTLLRPSMIYGPGNDRNISRLVAHLRLCRWLPVFGSGQGLQQPVYVEDVVSAILAAVRTPGAIGNSYSLAGPEAISYDRLVDLVGNAIGVVPLKVHIPVKLALAGLWLGSLLGARLGVDPEQVLRLQEDKVCSIEAAHGDLGYRPLGFAAGLAKIYGREGTA